MSNQTTLRRRLDPAAVGRAVTWRAKRLKELAVKEHVSSAVLTNKERHLLQRLRADRDIHGYAPYRNPRLVRRDVRSGEKDIDAGQNRRQLRRLGVRRNAQQGDRA